MTRVSSESMRDRRVPHAEGRGTGCIRDPETRNPKQAPTAGSGSTPDTSMAGPKLLDRMSHALRSRHYSRRTEHTYVMWVKRFVKHHGLRHPCEMAEPEINAFLSHLAVRGNVSSSTQNQALCAILFLYRHVLGVELRDLGEIARARRPKRLPVVLTRQEIRALMAGLRGDRWLMCHLMYGAGLRLMECLRLRVQDIDFAMNQITVRDGKGMNDRVTMLPEKVKTPLQRHLETVREIHLRDLEEGYGRVQMPYALERKFPNAAAEWRWQFIFPQEHRWKNTRTGEEGRHHVHETILQRAVKEAVSKAGTVFFAPAAASPAAEATDMNIADNSISVD